ncbi:MAG: VOC family protein [Methanomicrobiales archaeon]|nr:VOC family protein [Methanomicrobiales archaeon]
MPTIVHFDIPADDTARAKKFYSALFGWKFETYMDMDYHLVTTTTLDGSPGAGGGIGKRMNPSTHITDFFGVQSVDAAMKKVKALGGSVMGEKMPIPGIGWMGVCVDTEGNMFGVFEEDKGAK